MTKIKPLTAKKLDAYISDAYRVIAQGKMINIMDIGKVFNAGRIAYASTMDLAQVDAALAERVKLLCFPA